MKNNFRTSLVIIIDKNRDSLNLRPKNLGAIEILLSLLLLLLVNGILKVWDLLSHFSLGYFLAFYWFFYR